MYVENMDGKYNKYIEAYKEFVIDVAKLMIVANGDNENGYKDELEAMWNNMLSIETKVAEVILIIYRFLELIM